MSKMKSDVNIILLHSNLLLIVIFKCQHFTFVILVTEFGTSVTSANILLVDLDHRHLNRDY